MLLHLPTMFIVLLAGYGLLALELALAQRRLAAREELRRWSWGNALLLAGYAMLAARRGGLPVSASVVLGNGLILLGTLTFADALQRFITERPLPRWVRIVGGLSVLGMLPMSQLDTPWRFLTMSLLLPLPQLWILGLIWRERRRVEGALWTVAFTFTLVCVALLARAIHVLLEPQAYRQLDNGNWLQGILFLTSFLAMLGAGFGFVLACSERATRHMERLASHDHLTGALNRQAVELMLGHALQRARRAGRPLAFVLMDLDHFKQVNDRHGHAMGDEVLREFVRTVRTRLRESDLLARFGGEEFVLVLPDTDQAGAELLSETLRGAVAALQLRGPRGEPLPVSMSAGIAVSRAGEGELAQLYSAADRALYQAKRAGRNRVASAMEEARCDNSVP